MITNRNTKLIGDKFPAAYPELGLMYVRKLTCHEADLYDAATSDPHAGTYLKMARMAQVLACNASGEDFWTGDGAEAEVYNYDREIVDIIVAQGQDYNGLGAVDTLADLEKN